MAPHLRSAHADSAGTAKKPVPPPDLSGRDGIPVVDCSTIRGVKEDLGRYIYLAPEKLGGGAHAVDLYQIKTLAWISYWTYGDTCPIAHHLAAYPSPDPYKGFEFVNSTQGGDNVMIYGLNTKIKERGLLDTTMIVFTSDHGEFMGDIGTVHFVVGVHGLPVLVVILPPIPSGRSAVA
jgi:hypothetical protein